jgi:hypothetical protein
MEAVAADALDQAEAVAGRQRLGTRSQRVEDPQRREEPAVRQVLVCGGHDAHDRHERGS